MKSIEMAEYLFKGQLDNTVHDLSYEQIRQLYLDNRREEREGQRITASSYRGENYYDGINDHQIALQREYLYRDPKTAGMRMYYPHGVVIEQSMRRNYYRGENQLFPESLPSLHRALKKYDTKKDKELYRMVADMRVAEFSYLLQKFRHVQEWQGSDILYESLAQHYGLETGWLDITTDFNVALFFATCYWDRDLQKWQPLTRKQTEASEMTKYGMIYHMPSNRMPMRWTHAIPKFMPWSDKVVGHTDEGNAIYEHLDYPAYSGDVGNLIYPLGFQPFMRCHMQNGYGIYMRSAKPLQQDYEFEKLRFRHSEKLSRAVFELMEGGDLIYPHEGLKQAEFIIEEIRRTCTFSEDAFHYALYRNHYYRLEDAKQCKKDLGEFLVDGKPIVIQERVPWKISSGRRRRIDALYLDFSLEREYGIMIMERTKIPPPSPMFEPWMLPEEEGEPGVVDFKHREKVTCGSSIVERDLFNLMHTLMTASLPDF